MRRIVFWLLGTLSAVLLMFGYHTSTAGSMAATNLPAIVSGPVAGTSVSTATATGSAKKSKSATTAAKAATTTTVTGSVAQTQWGPVQVQLTISTGKITQVAVVQYPNGNGHDAQINSYALPILVKETTAAQSAKIDMVSGATVTSGGYLQSLQSALDQAHL